MKKRNISITMLSVFIICALLLAGNLLLGSLLLNRSKAQMKTLINQRMLDIANTSADMLDGDALEAFTEKSIGTPEYQLSFDRLKVFQDNIDLEYIYAVRDMKDGTFIFVVDPAEVDPGEYGEPIVVTSALLTAAGGTAAVDDDPYSDDWGKFYSAYSPVFNSAGEVAGIVCVDFRADWYDQQVSRYTAVVVLFSALSLLVGAAVVLLITSRMRGRMRALNRELEQLTGDVGELLREVNAGGESPAASESRTADTPRSSDEMAELAAGIRSMRKMLREHIEDIQTQANGMITAMAADYRSVYYVDLDRDEGICYRAHGKIDGGLREGERFCFSRVFRDYAEAYVAEKDRPEFLRVIDSGRIREELAQESIVSHRYLVFRDGQESYEMIRIAGVRHPEDRDDHIVHAVGVGFTDVDRETRETLRQQQALTDALAAAEGANAAKTAFLSSMSHEIRTPMNAIIGLDSIALRDPDLPERTREQLEKIGGSARHLLGLINDILDMSRIESGRMVLRNEEFSFSAMLEQINTMINGQCQDKGLTYDCRILGHVDDYYIGDDMKLKQVLINILGNAVKFTPVDGTVTFLVEPIAQFEDQSTLRFVIRDTGIGMDKEYIPRIFEAFSQEDAATTNKYGGTGLGMAITKSIVEMMNGSISVDSEKGVGTAFTVTVTLKNSDRTGGQPCGALRPRDMNVLIVDDDPVECQHAKLVLEEVGVSADTALSGAEALRMIGLRHARRDAYNLILVDWNMPEQDGVEVTRQIRGLYNGESTIIILTAYSWDDVMDEAMAAGVDSFMAKPLFAANVLEQFRQIIESKQLCGPGAERKAGLAGRRILLAEDMMINAEIMTEILHMRTMEVDHAENGQIVVDMFAKSPENYYDAIMMDVRMPVQDGLAATSAIRALNRTDAKTVPIIAMTANAFDEDVQRSLQVGMNAHLSKPVEPERLYETLESLIRD